MLYQGVVSPLDTEGVESTRASKHKTGHRDEDAQARLVCGARIEQVSKGTLRISSIQRSVSPSSAGKRAHSSAALLSIYSLVEPRLPCTEAGTSLRRSTNATETQQHIVYVCLPWSQWGRLARIEGRRSPLVVQEGFASVGL